MNRIVASLKADVAIYEVFGDYIYLDHATERRSHPYLVISLSPGRPVTTLCGDSGLDRGLYDFEFYCKNHEQRKEIFGLLRAWAHERKYRRNEHYLPGATYRFRRADGSQSRHR